MNLEDRQKLILRVLSAGYELGNGKLTDAQMINGKWWIPKWGCDSIDHMMDQLSFELSKQNTSSITGEPIFSDGTLVGCVGTQKGA